MTAVEIARAAHNAAHDAYRDHVTACKQCAHCERCRCGMWLLDAADDAGLRWEMAEARLARDARLAAV